MKQTLSELLNEVKKDKQFSMGGKFSRSWCNEVLVLPPSRIIFPVLVAPKKFKAADGTEIGDAKYSVSFLVSAKETKFIARINEIAKKLVVLYNYTELVLNNYKYKNKKISLEEALAATGISPDVSFAVDGNNKVTEGREYYEDTLIINGKSKVQVPTQKIDGNTFIEVSPDFVKAGMICSGQITGFSYGQGGSFGVQVKRVVVLKDDGVRYASGVTEVPMEVEMFADYMTASAQSVEGEEEEVAEVEEVEEEVVEEEVEEVVVEEEVVKEEVEVTKKSNVTSPNPDGICWNPDSSRKTKKIRSAKKVVALDQL